MTTTDLLAPKKRRNRARKPSWSFAGLDADHWRADSQRVRWAQTDANYRDLLTVLINERTRATAIRPGTSENRQLGLMEGYEAAIAVVQSLAGGVVPPTGPPVEAEYPPE